MALPRSSLSRVCRAIADFVSVGLDASANSIQVMVGSPASAAPAATDTTHRVNLFFYRIEPAGFFTGNTPGDPWWVRLHCLVTGFGIEEEQVSAGENDLRLLGEVMRIFHETPVQSALTVGDETFRLQVVFLPLGADDLNHIWSTQGDVSYLPLSSTRWLWRRCFPVSPAPKVRWWGGLAPRFAPFPQPGPLPLPGQPPRRRSPGRWWTTCFPAGRRSFVSLWMRRVPIAFSSPSGARA